MRASLRDLEARARRDRALRRLLDNSAEVGDSQGTVLQKIKNRARSWMSHIGHGFAENKKPCPLFGSFVI